jgi:hypothetical protein
MPSIGTEYAAAAVFRTAGPTSTESNNQVREYTVPKQRLYRSKPVNMFLD